MAQTWPAPKDPDEVKDYFFRWADLLDGDTILSSDWVIVDPLVPTLEIDDTDLQDDDVSETTNTKSVVWLSGGDLGVTYLLRNRITTAGGRTYDRTMKLKMKEL